jgi:hypothetical protein
MRARFLVSQRGSSGGTLARQLVRTFSTKPLTLSFDVRRVESRAHWTVAVTKYDPRIKRKPRAEVDIAQRRIFLTSFDTVPVTASRLTPEQAAGRRPGESDDAFEKRITPAKNAERDFVVSQLGEKRFRVAPHEFGHTLGRLDEYKPDSPDYADINSLLNVGRHLRPRHLQLVAAGLESMVPGCKFVAITSGTV